jgi:hypothetical protein
MQEAKGMTTAGASGGFPSLNGHGTALNPEGLPVDDDIGDLPTCRFDNPAERLPRNIHPRCSLFLIQSFEISES